MIDQCTSDNTVEFLNVEQIREFTDPHEFGVTLPGWYHWDETWSYAYGPFTKREDASTACREYARTL